MLHSPTSEAKDRNDAAPRGLASSGNRQTMLSRTNKAAARTASSISSQATPRPRAAGLQAKMGNQALLRMLQRKCSCYSPQTSHAEVSDRPPGIQTKLAIGQPGDQYEREADQVADQVMRKTDRHDSRSETATVAPRLQRACSCGESHGAVESGEKKDEAALQRASAAPPENEFAPPIVHEVLSSQGQPIDPDARGLMEASFGRDFSGVRVHTDTRAGRSAEAVNALAYTVGSSVVFGDRQYSPHTPAGRRLLSHELAHVVQQRGAPALASHPSSSIAPASESSTSLARREAQSLNSTDRPRLQRDTPAAPPAAASGTGAGAGAGTGSVCSIPAGCPPEFCAPESVVRATLERSQLANFLLAGIAVAVSPRVVPLWSQYIFGGAAPQDISAKFATDFSTSATTATTTDFLVDALKADIEANPPTFPAGTTVVTVDIPTRIGSAIAEIGNPASAHPMDFNVIGEIPGNIAGGIGKNQTSCKVGAKPSPFDDDRTAIGTADVTKNADGSLTVVPTFNFTVQDTIDLCPGNCGASSEQIATVPLSRWEATGISGDVPFTVNFPGPPRTITAHPTAPPVPVPPVPSPVTGPLAAETTASQLRIREAPNTSSATLGLYPRGSSITILCQTTGEVVEGNPTWDRTDRGFVSDRFVNRTGAGTPPDC